MNFFSAQQQARKRTKWLVLWFALGVLGTVGCLYVVANILSQWQVWGDWERMDWTGNPVALWTAVSGLVVIPLGSAFKLMQLSQGGAVVARDMGARPVDPGTREFAERQLLNVVEEMSIATGLPMPQVWVMDDEPSINAFAAGTEPSNAVVAVSRGCLQKLSRSELQGVVAHEFSHILNGDMRLNMRLIGWLFGLLMIAMLGRGLLSIFRHARVRSSGDNKNGGALVLALILTGVSLWLIGSLGVLFGRIIQAAVSRQREFLADASAVQFTRDPGGIAGALKKIARSQHQRIEAPKAGEAAHLFFSGAGGFLSGMLATHPPLVERIKAIEPSWDGDLRKGKSEEKLRSQKNVAPQGAVAAFSGVGEVASVDVPAAAVMRKAMKEQGKIRSVAEAKGLIYALIAVGEEVPSMQGGEDLSREERAALATWHQRCSQMSSTQKIAWMDLAMPLLRQMAWPEYEEFRDRLRAWMERDQQVTLFEWMLHHVIDRHLHVCFVRGDVTPMRWHDISQVEAAVADLMVCLCSLAEDNQTWTRFSEEYQRRYGRSLPQGTMEFRLLDRALRVLDEASPEVKRQVLDLGMWAMWSDGNANNSEIELLRAAADAIGAMLPPQSEAAT